MIAKILPMNIKYKCSGTHIRVFFSPGELKQLKASGKLIGDLIKIPYHIGDDFIKITVTCDPTVSPNELVLQGSLLEEQFTVLIGQELNDLLMLQKRLEYPCIGGQVDLLGKIVGVKEREEMAVVKRIICFHKNEKKWNYEIGRLDHETPFLLIKTKSDAPWGRPILSKAQCWSHFFETGRPQGASCGGKC